MQLNHFALAAILAAGTLSAQLPDWVPFPVTNPTRLFEEGHILVAQEVGAVHVFSTYTRRWATIQTTSPSAQFFGFDDHVVIQDGNSFSGFAVRYGVFVPVATSSPSPFSLTLPSASFLSVVIDGPDLHTFSPFTGTWNTLHTSIAGPLAAASSVAVFSDGSTVFGYSPFYNQFVPLQATGAISSTSAAGYCAYATDGQIHYAFSAVQNSWTTLPSAPAAVAALSFSRNGNVVLSDGIHVDLFSGITGQYTRIAVTQTPTITRGEQIVVVEDFPITHVWSAITNTTGFFVSTAPPILTVTQYIALLQDGQDLHVFSAPKGAFGPTLQGTWSPTASYSVAFATDGIGGNMAYSALLNTWAAGPNGSFGSALTQNGAVMQDVGRYLHGYSARTGAWSTIATGTIDTTVSHGSSYCARAGNDLYAFNERYGHWAHTTTTSPARLTTKRETVVADYGSEAQAYCIWNDHWAPRQLSSPAISVLVSDDSALIQDSNGLHGFGGSCQVSTWGLYPEWWRFITRGTACPIHVAGEPGAGALLAMSFGSTSLTIPGIPGQLGVPLNHSSLMFGIIPSEGMWVVPLTVPNLPALAGLTLNTQALVWPPSGPYFTTVFPTTIL